MGALKKCIEAIEGYEKELGMTKTPLAKAGRAELAALEADREALLEIKETHKRVMSEDCAKDERHCTCVPFLREQLAAYKAVAEAARTGVGLDDALDKLDELKDIER